MKTASLTRIALFTALTAVSVYFLPPFQIPGMAVTFTLQTLFVVLAGFILSPWEAFVAMAAYLAVGAMGLPVFSNGQGGFQTFLGPTGGFLVAFPFVAYAISKFGRNQKTWIGEAGVAVLAGIGLMYPFAVGWLSVVATTPYWPTLWAMAPFILVDLIKIAVALFIARKIRRTLSSV